jgi:hypothetical protein
MFWPAGVTKKNKFRMGKCTADYFGCPLFFCFGKPTKNINTQMLKGVKTKKPHRSEALLYNHENNLIQIRLLGHCKELGIRWVLTANRR